MRQMEDRKWRVQCPEKRNLWYWTFKQPEQQCDEKPLSSVTDLSGMDNFGKTASAEHKKYNFKVTGEFSTTTHNAWRCTVHKETHKCVSGMNYIISGSKMEKGKITSYFPDPDMWESDLKTRKGR